MKKVLFRCRLCPGDILMLTAAIRDLHKCYPDQYITGVDSTSYSLWDNNPYITRFDESEAPEVEIVECHYELINHSNQRPYHFIHGYIQHINKALNLNIVPTEFKGDIHLSPKEKIAKPIIQKPYWIVAAGGKFDFTAKWWSHKRYQEVINHFKGKVQFVQIGARGDYHMPLDNVIDMRAKTTLRDLVNLVYHSQGVVCPITAVMHLAAAVECKAPLQARPCVVIAGGREPTHWEAYPHHQFIHTIGALNCCAKGGCWKSRTVRLNDGKDADNSLCVNVVNQNLPKCMDMITSDEVIRRIELYFNNPVLQYETTL